METEPLLTYFSPRKKPLPSVLTPLPEDTEINIPINPSEIKDCLIFGSPSTFEESSPLVEAITLSLNSPKASQSQQNQQTQQSFPGDSTCRWKKNNFHRCKTAPAMVVVCDSPNHQPTEPKPQFVSDSIIQQTVLLLLVYLSCGVLIYWFNRQSFKAEKTNHLVDALYYCVVTMCTIGYGDIVPNSPATKIFSILFVLVGFGFIDILLSGVLSYVLNLQESHLLKTVENKGEKDKKSYIIDVKKGRMRIRMKVALALGVVVFCIGVGVCFLHFVERLGWLDSLYLSVMSVTTVGYGDNAFKSVHGRMFAAIWLLVSTLAVARAFLYLAEARVDRRNRQMTKWILGQDMTVSQFLAADLDNNGFVSKSEFVIYKLKEMGKVSDKDIMQVCQKFDRLDAGNCGKLSLADLMEAH